MIGIAMSLVLAGGFFLYERTIEAPAEVITPSEEQNAIPENESMNQEKPLGQSPQGSITPNVDNPTIPVSVEGVREIMAWIYPGAPACGAQREYSDGRTIHTLKAEYYRVIEGGVLEFLSEDEQGCNGYSVQNIASIKKYSREQYVTVASAYAGDMDLFIQKALQDQSAISTLVDFTVQNNITGVELDFEDFGGWSPAAYARYREFVNVLGNELHANGKKLMIDGPAISNLEEQSWFPWKYEDFVSLPVDRIVVMAYDYQFDHGSGNPVAPIEWIKNVTNWTKTKYPYPARITIGIPAYGYKGVDGTQQFSLMTYEQIQKEPGFSSAVRDQSSAEMTWKNASNVYFYQDTVSLSQKIKAVTDSGIDSISIWHLGGNQWFK